MYVSNTNKKHKMINNKKKQKDLKRNKFSFNLNIISSLDQVWISGLASLKYYSLFNYLINQKFIIILQSTIFWLEESQFTLKYRLICKKQKNLILCKKNLFHLILLLVKGIVLDWFWLLIFYFVSSILINKLISE